MGLYAIQFSTQTGVYMTFKMLSCMDFEGRTITGDNGLSHRIPLKSPTGCHKKVAIGAGFRKQRDANVNRKLPLERPW
jgi:hypothetical protein